MKIMRTKTLMALHPPGLEQVEGRAGSGLTPVWVVEGTSHTSMLRRTSRGRSLTLPALDLRQQSPDRLRNHR